MPNFILIVLVLMMTGCTSTIEYTSRGKVPVYLNAQRFHPVNFEMTEKLDFYLFGHYPEVYKLHLDELAARDGYFSLSGLTIHEYQNVGDTILSVLTLGLYTPRTVVISGLAKQ